MPPTGGDAPDPWPGSRYSSFLERLRARPLSSWSHGDRYRAARKALVALAELGWVAEGRAGSPPEVADLGPVAVGDQLTVLLVDAQSSGADPRRLAVLVGDLADALHIRLDGRKAGPRAD